MFGDLAFWAEDWAEGVVYEGHYGLAETAFVGAETGRPLDFLGGGVAADAVPPGGVREAVELYFAVPAGGAANSTSDGAGGNFIGALVVFIGSAGGE